MSRYLARSAALLSAADRFETQMSWLLFVAEQEALLATDNEWSPGDPLYERPAPYDVFGVPTGQQHVRQMIQEIPLDEFHVPRFAFSARCTDCMVNWRGPEPCWSCGMECKELYHQILLSQMYGRTYYDPDRFEFIGDDEAYSIAMSDEEVEVWENLNDSQIRVSIQQVLIDEVMEHFGLTIDQARALLGIRITQSSNTSVEFDLRIYDAETLRAEYGRFEEYGWMEERVNSRPSNVDVSDLFDDIEAAMTRNNIESTTRANLDRFIQATTRRMDRNPFNLPATERRRPRNI